MQFCCRLNDKRNMVIFKSRSMQQSAGILHKYLVIDLCTRSTRLALVELVPLHSGVVFIWVNKNVFGQIFRLLMSFLYFELLIIFLSYFNCIVCFISIGDAFNTIKYEWWSERVALG